MKLQQEAIRLGMKAPSTKPETPAPLPANHPPAWAAKKARVNPAQPTETRAERRARLLAEQRAAMASDGSESEVAPILASNSMKKCDDFFGSNDVASEDVVAFERDSAEAVDFRKYVAEVVAEKPKVVTFQAVVETIVDRPSGFPADNSQRSPEIANETRAERRARLMAEQRALMASDSESEEESEAEEEESADEWSEDADEASEEADEVSEAAPLPKASRLSTVDEESEADETDEESEAEEADEESEAEEADEESEAEESDDESEEPVAKKPQATFIPSTSFETSSRVVGKSAALMADDDMQDIKYARLRNIHQVRRKAAPKIQAVTSFKSRARQRKRSITCLRFGRHRCPGISKTSPGPGSYNVSYSSFGQSKSFSTRKGTFGSTVSGSRMHVLKSGQVIYKTMNPATRRAGARTVQRPAWSLKQRRRKQTPLRRNLHTNKPSPRSKTTRSQAKTISEPLKRFLSKVVDIDAELAKVAPVVEEPTPELITVAETTTEVVESNEAEEASEATEEEDSDEEESEAEEEESEAAVVSESSCDFEGDDDISDMGGLADLLRAHGISGY